MAKQEYNITLAPEKTSIISPELKGNPFYANTIPEGEKKILASGLTAATMPLLVNGLKHSNGYTADSGDLSGLDKYHKYTDKDHVVVTLHGGMIKVLPPETLERALELHQNSKGGINDVWAAVFKDISRQDPLALLLNEKRLPDNTKVEVLDWRTYANEGRPNVYTKPFAVVRPLNLARKTVSGYEPTNRLTDTEGNVTDSQVITYAGSKKAAQSMMNKIRNDLKWQKFGVWHPFNSKEFNPDESQGRFLFLGNDHFYGLDGGNNLVYLYSCFVGVAPEALNAFEKSASETAPLENRITNALREINSI